jgi:cyclophilin family peptidyl-prolyl cis-trans isomerase
MAKRRRRYDEKKIHRKDKRSRHGHRRQEEKDVFKEESHVERRPPKISSQKKKDMSVIISAIIVIVILAGGYIFYTNYYDTYFGEDNDGSNDDNNIIPNQPSNGNGNGNGNDYYNVPSFQTSDPGNSVAIIEVKDYGVIVVELFNNKNVQVTVDNFLDYARRNFYDGLIFHRVIDGFMIQGGGFTPDLTEKNIPADKGPIPLEIDQTLKHLDGSIAMARTNDPNSATCQFFINDGAQPGLEPGGADSNGYAVFGQVVAGMEIVRQISAVETGSEGYYDDVPVNDVIIRKVYEYFGPTV